MNERFRKTLVLALRPDTGEHEAAAAFSALRRMASDGNVTNLFDANTTQIKEKVVYKEKVIYMSRDYTHTFTYATTVSATFLHAYIHKVFTSAIDCGMNIHLISLEVSTLSGPTKIKFKILGYERQLKEFKDFLIRLEKEMASKSKDANKDTFKNLNSKRPSFLSRIFRVFFPSFSS